MSQHKSGLDAAEYHKLTGFEGDWRDSWWDEDYLAFMASRWRLAEVRAALDLGCGVGHWGQRLARYFHPEARMVGIDAEPEWMAGAAERARARGLRATYQVADARELPFEDDRFDLVTCQTVLMHIDDVDTVLQQARRVLRPGGLFLCAEPNNFGSSAAEFVRDPVADWPTMKALMELEITCARGKEALGEGWYSIGERIPKLLRAQGFSEVDLRLNNQCAPLVPGDGTVALMKTTYEAGGITQAGGTRENAERMWLAGGGDPTRFEELFQIARRRLARVIEAAERGEATGAGGHLHYLIWGRKPGLQ